MKFLFKLFNFYMSYTRKKWVVYHCNYTVFQKKFTLLLFAITNSDVDRFQ